MGRALFDCPASPLSYTPPHAHLALAVAASTLLLQGCFTPPELRDRADRDAYALIDARRKQLLDQVIRLIGMDCKVQ